MVGRNKSELWYSNKGLLGCHTPGTGWGRAKEIIGRDTASHQAFLDIPYTQDSW
jgi:hypothetical protein